MGDMILEKLDVRGVEVQLSRAGRGQPLLLLDSGFSFEHDFAGRLAERFQVIAPLHPGFGGARRPDQIDTVDDLAYLYLDLLQQLDLRDVTIVGCSMGGWIAAEVAVRCSDRLARLVLVDALGIKVSDRETPDIADMFAISDEELMALLFRAPAKFKIDANALSERALAHVAEDRASLALYLWEPYAHNPKLLGRLGRIELPTLVVWGQHDGLVKPEYGRRFAAAIPGAAFEIVPDCGHLPQVERPDRLMEYITAFAADGRTR
ncbi:MAG TPA: alpha/beta hydrolase [Candidatus Binataceae bacterium]|nr:alpha/beta hydrolase [Candidatus Binataceae bacterium]